MSSLFGIFVCVVTQSSLIMRCPTIVFMVLVAIHSVTNISAPPFHNLDFERATTNNISVEDPSRNIATGPISDLLPGWQIEQTLLVTPAAPSFFESRTNQLNALWFRAAPELLPTVAVLTDQNDVFPDFPKAGTFSLVLSTLRGHDYETCLTLIQSGDVPQNATELQIAGLVGWVGGVTPPQATINGMPLAPSRLGSGWIPGAWDVSAFAGQTVEFQFTLTPGFYARIDGLAFIPEPAPRLLWACGAVGLLIGMVWRHKSRSWSAAKAVGAEPRHCTEHRDCAAVSIGAPSARRR